MRLPGGLARQRALPLACASRISACGREARWESALHLLARPAPGPLPDAVCFNAAVGACSRAARWAWALRLLSDAAAQRLATGAVGLNAAIAACGRGRQWPWALWLLRGAAEALARPDGVSYNAGISACERAALWRAALQLLVEARGAALAPGLLGWNAAASAASRAARWRLALALVAGLRGGSGAALQPDLVSFNAVLDGCRRAAQWERAVSLLRALPRFQVAPDVVSFSMVLTACSTGHRWAKALRILRKMSQSGIKADVVCCSAAISACEKAALWADALALLRGMRASSCTPNTFSYSAAIGACEGAARWRSALLLLTTMEAGGLWPSRECFNSAASAVERAGHWSQVVELLEKMWEASAGPDAASYSIALRALVRGMAWARSLELVDDAVKQSVSLGATSLAASLSALEAAGQTRRMDHLMEKMLLALAAGCAAGALPIAGGSLEEGSLSASVSQPWRSPKDLALAASTLRRADAGFSALGCSSAEILFRCRVQAPLVAQLRLAADPELVAREGKAASCLHRLSRPLLQGVFVDIGPWVAVLYCFYVAFCVFALMNVVTGEFVEKAMQTAQDHKDMYLANRISEVFFAGTETGSDHITWEVFAKKMESPDMREYFKAINVDPSEAFGLFRLLDTDGSGDVDCEEIVNGLLRLRGTARALELSLLTSETNRIHQALTKHFEDFERRLISITRLVSKVRVDRNTEVRVDRNTEAGPVSSEAVHWQSTTGGWS